MLSVNTAHSGQINSLCFLHDGLHLLSFGTDNNLRLWDATTGRNTLVNYGKITNRCRKAVKVAVSRGTTPTVAFVPSDGDVVACDVFGGSIFDTLRGHYNQVNCCIINPDIHEMYSGSNDRNILAWTPDVDVVRAYEEEVRGGMMRGQAGRIAAATNFTSRVGGGLADSWSSGED